MLQSGNQQTLNDARKLYLSGQYLRAIPICKRLLKTHKNNPDVLFVLGACEVSAALFDDAKAHLEAAIKKKPTDAQFYRPLATVHLMYGRFDEAHAALDRALSFNPSFAPVIADKAELLLLEGDTDDARSLIEPLVSDDLEDGRVASTYARLCRQTGEIDKGIGVLERFLARPGLVNSQIVGPVFRLALLYDKAGRYDEAFAALQRGNRISRPAYKASETTKLMDEAIASWSGAMPNELSQEVPPRMVFVVGMPRSGTSLVEQVIATHPDAYGAGELDLVVKEVGALQRAGAVRATGMLTTPELCTPQVLGEAASRYRAGLADLCAPTAGVVTDKLPTNFMNLGLIASMFPDARIVHCTRDPMDTILSCYMQNFAGSVPFSYDLEDLAHFYRDYQRLMQHWSGVLDVPIHEANYERIVADPEAELRGLIDGAGLEWDERCLRFHESRRVTRTASNEQVRQPMYASSVKRSDHYAAFLEPARKILEAS